MKFDKSIGTGYWNVKDSTLLDDVAFSLLCEKIKMNNGNYINQAFFMNYKAGFPYNKYYEEAKLILRKEKIKNVSNRVQTKSN